MTMRAMGPFNGLLPAPTGIAIAHMRDPKECAYLNYAQLVPVQNPKNPQFMWARLDINNPSRMVSLDQYAWDYGDYRPSGKDHKLRADMQSDRVQRWDFPYTIDSVTEAAWGEAGINYRALADFERLNHAHLHRAVRVVNAIRTATFASANTGTPQSLLGLGSPVYLNESSGRETNPGSGTPNPKFQIFKKVLQAIQKRIHIVTNGAVKPRHMQVVLTPGDAQMLSQTGEMFEALKQSVEAAKIRVNEADVEFIERWSLPPNYGGFKFVVEDTPRVVIRQKEGDTGTIEDVSIPSDKDYIMPEGDAMYFTLRQEGIDGTPGSRTFSTIQIYHRNGEARIEGFSDPKNDLFEGHVVMEDKVVIPTTAAAFKLNGFRNN